MSATSDAITVGIGAGGLLLGIIGTWLTQRNRDQDKADQALLALTAKSSEDTKTALQAWQSIVAANNQHLALQAAEIKELRDRAEACESRERILRTEFEAFKIAIAKGIEDRRL